MSSASTLSTMSISELSEEQFDINPLLEFPVLSTVPITRELLNILLSLVHNRQGIKDTLLCGIHTFQPPPLSKMQAITEILKREW